jgi:hypothetical protein
MHITLGGKVHSCSADFTDKTEARVCMYLCRYECQYLISYNSHAFLYLCVNWKIL